MPVYIPKPEPIEVYQWKKNGDAPGDGVINNINSGAIVGRHITYGSFTGGQLCPTCGKQMGQHGTMKKPIQPNVVVVCPGDWLRIHRDDKKRILGYSTVIDKVIQERYIDIALLPPPIPQQVTKK